MTHSASKVFRRVVRPDRLLHPPVWICLADRTGKTEFLHQPPDLLSVHPDAGMQQPHMDAAHAFGVTTKPVSLQNLLEIRRILCLPRVNDKEAVIFCDSDLQNRLIVPRCFLLPAAGRLCVLQPLKFVQELPHPRYRHGLQDIIEHIDAEGIDRVLLVCGYKSLTPFVFLLQDVVA